MCKHSERTGCFSCLMIRCIKCRIIIVARSHVDPLYAGCWPVWVYILGHDGFYGSTITLQNTRQQGSTAIHSDSEEWSDLYLFIYF